MRCLLSSLKSIRCCPDIFGQLEDNFYFLKWDRTGKTSQSWQQWCDEFECEPFVEFEFELWLSSRPD